MARTAGESRPISVRAPDELHERIERLAAKNECTKSQWVLAALEVQAEHEERSAVHTPQVVLDSMPRRVGVRMAMPQGVVRPLG